MLEKISEKELIKKCLSGSEEAVREDAVREDAWEELYKRYYALVRSVISYPRYGFSPDTYNDHIQEIFLELVKALKTFKQDCKLSTFIVKIAQNKCVSHLRMILSQKRPKNELLVSLEEKRSENEDFIPAAASNGDPQMAFLEEEEKKQVKLALSKLKSECKTILFLRFFMYKSYQEIADSLKLPLGTVCINIRRCLLNLRKLYLSIND